jgi:hypothetical protein
MVSHSHSHLSGLDINAIRNIITQALINEAETDSLARQLEAHSVNLHNSIRLPLGESEQVLLNFITRYIQHVPDYLEALIAVSAQASITKQTRPILNVARDYFLLPPQQLQIHVGLEALMDEAYLAHRLIEEINDQLLVLCGVPLTPMDMTRANLIVHHLIGEPFANELDNMVHHSVSKLAGSLTNFESSAFRDYVDDHKHRGWQDEVERWPCLAENLSIELAFSKDKTAPSIIHETPSNGNLH